MAATLIERVWAWLHAIFPERQLYLRSDGQEQCVTLSPALQAICAALALMFLGWVTFASINVLFKDQVIAAKDRRYEQMQAGYQSRLANLQISYDALNGALVRAAGEFRNTADQLEAKQQSIAALLDHKAMVDHALGAQAAPMPLGNSSAPAMASGSGDGLFAAAIAPPAPPSAKPDNADNGALVALPQPPAPQPRVAKPTKAAVLDMGVLVRLTGDLVQAATRLFPHHSEPERGMAMKLPAFRALLAQTARLQRLNSQETALLRRADQAIAQQITRLDTTIRDVGIQPWQIQSEVAAQGIGGQRVPSPAAWSDGIADRQFTSALVSAQAHIAEMNALFAVFQHIPLAIPVRGAGYEVSSDFGPRIDPFSHQVSFHPGIDFAGPWGSLIEATAPGVVVFAGFKGGYGNCVEINHGLAIHTRYGHLSAILVEAGDHVQQGTPIGSLGSTGRSTGPHVHYEIWQGDTLRDPRPFIAAGQTLIE